MGLSSKKSKSTSTVNQNTTMNTTPTNPDWVVGGVQDATGRVNDFFRKLDPYSLVAGADPLQTQAAGSAAGLGASPNFAQASDMFRSVGAAGPQSIDAVDISGGINKFLNPYLKDVVDTSLVNFDEGAGMTRAENALALANDTTFGGSGGAIQTALTERGLAQDRAKLAAELRSGGYDRAASLSAQQAAMDLQQRMSNANFGETALQRQAGAAAGLADVGALQGSEARANTGLQFDIGEALRAIAQQKAMAPVGALGMETGLLGQLPFDLFKGANSTGTMSGTSTTKTKESGASLGDWLSYFAANARAAGG